MVARRIRGLNVSGSLSSLCPPSWLLSRRRISEGSTAFLLFSRPAVWGSAFSACRASCLAYRRASLCVA